MAILDPFLYPDSALRSEALDKDKVSIFMTRACVDSPVVSSAQDRNINGNQQTRSIFPQGSDEFTLRITTCDRALPTQSSPLGIHGGNSAGATAAPAPAQTIVSGTESQTLKSAGGGLHCSNGASATCTPVQDKTGITGCSPRRLAVWLMESDGRPVVQHHHIPSPRASIARAGSCVHGTGSPELYTVMVSCRRIADHRCAILSRESQRLSSPGKNVWEFPLAAHTCGMSLPPDSTTLMPVRHEVMPGSGGLQEPKQRAFWSRVHIIRNGLPPEWTHSKHSLCLRSDWQMRSHPPSRRPSGDAHFICQGRVAS